MSYQGKHPHQIARVSMTKATVNRPVQIIIVANDGERIQCDASKIAREFQAIPKPGQEIKHYRVRAVVAKKTSKKAREHLALLKEILMLVELDYETDLNELQAVKFRKASEECSEQMQEDLEKGETFTVDDAYYNFVDNGDISDAVQKAYLHLFPETARSY